MGWALCISYTAVHPSLYPHTTYFRPPKTLPCKNLEFSTLNFAAVGVSLFSAGTALLGSVFLLGV